MKNHNYSQMPRLPPLEEVLSAVRKNDSRSSSSELSVKKDYTGREVIISTSPLITSTIEKINPKLRPYEFSLSEDFLMNPGNLVNLQQLEQRYSNARLNFFHAISLRLSNIFKEFGPSPIQEIFDQEYGPVLNKRLIFVNMDNMNLSNYVTLISNGIGIGD